MNDNKEVKQKPHKYSYPYLFQAFAFVGLYLILSFNTVLIAQDPEAESVDLIELQDQLIKEKNEQNIENGTAPREPLGLLPKTDSENQLQSKTKVRTRNEKNRKKRIKERLKKN